MVAVLHTIALFTNFAGIFETCGNVLLFATIVLWLINFYHHIAYISFDLYIFQLGVLILVTGATGNQIYNRFGFPGKFLYLFPACIIAFVVLIFFASKFYQKQLLTHTQNLLKLEKEATKMQTAMLANQIKPHFLYNTLTIIQEMCYTEPEQAAEMIVHFSQYLRTNIDFMDYTELIPFVKELEHVENFLYIQKARFGESLHFEKEIDTTDFMIPPLSVQPIIENAIKYGIRHNDDQGSVTLTVREDAIGLHIEVRNSGPGFNESDLKQHHSIDNIRTRLASLLQGELRIHSTADVPGTVMEIFIPQTNIQRAGHYLHETGELQ
jgi:sensor histidine kinase YesM